MSFLSTASLPRNILQIVGASTLCYLCLRSTSLLSQLLLPSKTPRYLHAPAHQTWAFVTGSSDGVGFGFAEELASRGFNIILHGRNRTRLENAASRLRASFPHCQTRLFVADACSPEPFDADALSALIADLHLTVLVNNVGGSPTWLPRYQPLQHNADAGVDATVNMNVRFATKLTRTVLPSLLANQPSLLLNVSGLGTLGVPGLAVYSGTKGYVDAWTEALHVEMVDAGARVDVHAPVLGLVQSSTQRRGAGLFVPTSRQLARETLDRVGKADVIFVPHLPHAWQRWLLLSLPRGWRTKAMIGGVREEESWAREQERGQEEKGKG